MYISSFHNRGGLRRQVRVCICCRVLHLLLWIGNDSRSCVSNAQCCWNKVAFYRASVRTAWLNFPVNLNYTHTQFFWLCLSVFVSKLPVSRSDQRDEIVDCQATGVSRHLNSCQPFHMRFSDSRRKGLRFLRLGSTGCC